MFHCLDPMKTRINHLSVEKLDLARNFHVFNVSTMFQNVKDISKLQLLYKGLACRNIVNKSRYEQNLDKDSSVSF